MLALANPFKSPALSATLAALPALLNNLPALPAFPANFTPLKPPSPIKDKPVNPILAAKLAVSFQSQPSFAPCIASAIVDTTPPATPTPGKNEAIAAPVDIFSHISESLRVTPKIPTKI